MDGQSNSMMTRFALLAASLSLLMALIMCLRIKDASASPAIIQGMSDFVGVKPIGDVPCPECSKASYFLVVYSHSKGMGNITVEVKDLKSISIKELSKHVEAYVKKNFPDTSGFLITNLIPIPKETYENERKK